MRRLLLLRKRLFIPLLATLLWLPVVPSYAQTPPESGTQGDAGAAETEQEAPKPPRYLTATVVVTKLDEVGEETVRRFSLRKFGNKVRTIAEVPGESQFVGNTLYDYGTQEYFRKLIDQNITFSYRMADRERIRAQIFGYMNEPPEEPFFRVEVNTDLTFDGHPCTLSLVGFPVGGRIHALHWVWEAQDLNDAVVRVVFPETSDRIVIVEYRDAHDDPFDPTELSLPDDMVVMSGF